MKTVSVKNETYRLQVIVTRTMKEEIDHAVKDGLFLNANDFVRHAIRELVRDLR